MATHDCKLCLAIVWGEKIKYYIIKCPKILFTRKELLFMYDFPTIDEIHEMLDDIADEIPKYFFEQLNEGIVLLPEYKIHPESRDIDTLYILGEYSRSLTGRHIVIYYGSLERVYSGASMRALRNKLKDTLLHEFTHHLESLAGERGLEIKDFHDIQEYRRKNKD